MVLFLFKKSGKSDINEHSSNYRILWWWFYQKMFPLKFAFFLICTHKSIKHAANNLIEDDSIVAELDLMQTKERNEKSIIPTGIILKEWTL